MGLGNMYNFQVMWSDFSVTQFSIFQGQFYENVTLLSISYDVPKIIKFK